MLKHKILFPESGILSMTPPSMEDISKTLKHLQQKETRLLLHGTTLSEYVRSKRIRCGLRIQKAPTLGRGNDDFCTKWCEILNKASLDLMVLVIEYTHDELKSVRADIQVTKDTAHTMMNEETVLTLETDLKKSLDEYQDMLQKMKMRKFKRDTMDYKDDKVYPWRSSTSIQKRRGKQVRFHEALDLTTASSSEYLSESDGDFLDAPPPIHRSSRYPTRRRGHAGADGAHMDGWRKSTRPQRDRKKN